MRTMHHISISASEYYIEVGKKVEMFHLKCIDFFIGQEIDKWVVDI